MRSNCSKSGVGDKAFSGSAACEVLPVISMEQLTTARAADNSGSRITRQVVQCEYVVDVPAVEKRVFQHLHRSFSCFFCGLEEQQYFAFGERIAV